MIESLAHALDAWRQAIGPDFVVTDEGALLQARTATFATQPAIPVILRPGDREQVQECLRIANRFRIPVYPVSSGKNWGYGSRVPAADGCALMELTRLNRILDFNEEQAYITLEAGVTQRQLIAFLRERGSRLWMDSAAATLDSSLIGNTVERGFGHTPYGDHFAHVCGLEVVLPDGDVIETGFARFPKNRTASLYRWGVGPSIDGLFSQSNFGVVTRLSLWLMPAPEYFQAFFFRADREDRLGPIIDTLRPLRLNRTINSALHIGNDYKILSALRQYPWDETRGQTPLGKEWMKLFGKKMKFGAWNGSGALYGSRAQVRAARSLLRRALRGQVDQLQFMDDTLIALAETFAKPYQMLTGWDLSRILELVKPVYNLMKGIPGNESLASSYWRKKTPIPADMDPDRDRCGLIWCAPVAPTGGRHAVALTRMVDEILFFHGFEPIVALTLLTERTMDCVVSISYDRDVPGEDERALACHDQLLSRVCAAGYHPYRLGIQSMAVMREANGYNRFLGTLKRALDPGNILSPGRYQPLLEA